MFEKILTWWDSTQIHEQVVAVDYIGLFTNPWFLVPFVCLMGYLLYKQSWKEIVIIGILIAIWWVTGTEYMDSLIVNGEVQIDKVLPVAFGGAAVLGLVIYLLFGRSD